MPKIGGVVLTVRHQSDGGFWVFMLNVNESDPEVPDPVACVAGRLAGLLQVRPGTPVGFTGTWKKHPKFGRQFVPSGWYPYARKPADVARFLHECIEGFTDPGLAKLLADRFGLDTFKILSTDPDRVRALAGADDPFRVRLDTAILGWAQAMTVSALGAYLADLDLPAGIIERIARTFGVGALDTVLQDPYRLMEVEGFTFSKTDRFASRVGITARDPRRVDGAVLWVLRLALQDGHLFLRRGDVHTLIAESLEAEHAEPFGAGLSEAVTAAIQRLATRKAVRVEDGVGVYLPHPCLYESEAAKKLAQLVTPADLAIDPLAFVETYERHHSIDLSEAQRDGVHKLAQNRVLVLTGLPGTGKTTLIRAFVHLFKAAGMSFQLMAPTAIAAKRLAGVTGSDAATVHRSLHYDGEGWGYNASNRLLVDAVVVDEMSMVDQELFYRLLDALNPGVMLVLVGDDAQLPSVGAGNVLRELIQCQELPHVRLTQIHRQVEASKIVLSAHRVNRGEMPILDRNPSDFQFVPSEEEDTIADLIVKMAEKLKSRDANFQVLSPKYAGTIGVDNLNSRLREVLNPPEENKKEWAHGSFHVRLGDRLMVTRNNYDLAIYNGDMGKLHEVKRDYLVVRIHGVGAGSVDTYADIPKDLAPEILRLAYAITVHKSQGSEYDTVILPILRSHGRMLQRELFYTAITRAKKKVWLLGAEDAIRRAVANDQRIFRNTILARLVTRAIRVMQSGVGEADGRQESASVGEQSAGQPLS